MIQYKDSFMQIIDITLLKFRNNNNPLKKNDIGLKE